MLRQQLPVSSPIAARALVRALGPVLSRPRALPSVEREIERRFNAKRAILTDSGTSALVLALRLAVGERGTVAFPAYACVDLAAAARFAGVRVRVYDIDPGTLNVDFDSLRRTLERGVDAVVVAHLFGYAADISAVSALCAKHGVTVVEDAAQAAGGTLNGRPLGSFGPIAILSFGRGKGITCGKGGALLSHASAWTEKMHQLAQQLGPGDSGLGQLGMTALQWLIGRPATYAIPANIPALRLGEMTYHPAHEPRALSDVAACLLADALQCANDELSTRRSTAQELERTGLTCGDLQLVRPILGASSGYLRFPVLDFADRKPAPRLGILKGYPRALPEQPELTPCLCPDEPPMPGAIELRRRLFTIPTHSLLNQSDKSKILAWIRSVDPPS